MSYSPRYGRKSYSSGYGRKSYSPGYSRKPSFFSNVLNMGFHGSINHYKSQVQHGRKVSLARSASRVRKTRLLFSKVSTFFKR